MRLETTNNGYVSVGRLTLDDLLFSDRVQFFSDSPTLFEDAARPIRDVSLDDVNTPLHEHACGCPGCAASSSRSANSEAFTTVSDFTALLAPGFTWDFYRWNANFDDPAIGVTFVTFSFTEADDLPDPGTVANTPDAVFSFSEAQREATREALAEFSKNSGLIFIEVASGAMIDFTGVTGSGYGGFAYYPGPSRGPGGGVFMEGTSASDYSAGTGGFQILLHEIGHAVGLKHPFEGDIRLDEGTDNTSNTVMSYDWVGANKSVLSPLDLDAIRFLYGEDVGTAALNFYIDDATQQFVVFGSDGDDVASGIHLSNFFDGGLGNDTFLGGPLADILNGGDGNDTLVGTRGADVITGGNGADTIVIGGRDGETVDGGAGDDLVIVDALDNLATIRLGDGDDTLQIRTYGARTAVDIDTGGGFDRLELIGLVYPEFAVGAYLDNTYGSYNDFDEIVGSAYDDTYSGYNWGTDSFFGGAGDDRIFGNSGDDTLSGGDGDDYIAGGSGADLIDGGAGVDTAFYGWDFPIVVDLEDNALNTAQARGDILIGIENIVSEATESSLYGDSGANRLQSSDGADRLFGRGGNDILEGGSGADVMDGGEGFDLVSYENASSGVTFFLGSTIFNTGDAAGDTYVSMEGVLGSAFADLLGGDNGANGIDGGEGNDYLIGAGGDDNLIGGQGNDVLFGGLGADILNGGEGEDVAYYREAAAGVVVDYTDVANNTNEAAGDSYIAVDNIWGSDFGDVLTHDEQSGQVYGFDGDDQLYGNDGDDNMYGGAGADIINGGAGADTFFHLFYDSEGGDTIQSFVSGEDRLFVSRFWFGISDGGPASQISANAADFITDGVSTNAGKPAFIYDSETRTLSFDPDGEGGVGPFVMATFDANSTFDFADIWSA